MLIREIFKNVCTPEAARHIFQCGVEHEIENISSDYFSNDSSPIHFNVEGDGSLINGIEFTTSPAGVASQVDFFRYLQKTLPKAKIGSGEPYSDRTSTHVHVCVADLNESQLAALVYMYSLLEPYFFAYVGEEREHNIHCVPLWATNTMQKFGKFTGDGSASNIISYVNSWHKYTALNLKPVKNLNTIEFRHLFGTDHEESFTMWLNILEALYNWAYKYGEKFFNTELKQLITSGYPIVEKYILTQTGDLGEYMASLTPYVNRERCNDVYLSTLTNLFGGVSSIANLTKGLV